MLLQGLPGEAHEDGAENGGEDAEKKNEGEVVLDEGDVAEEVARPDDRDGPEDGARAAEEFEAKAVHAGRARDEGREGAHDRDETGEKDGLAAVLHVEVVGRGELLRIDPGDAPVVDLVAEPLPGGVAHRIPEDGAERHGEHDDPGTRGARRRHGARDEEERVAREEGHDHEARFEEEDQEHRDVDERAVVRGERDEKVIRVGEEIDDKTEDVHGVSVEKGPSSPSGERQGFGMQNRKLPSIILNAFPAWGVEKNQNRNGSQRGHAGQSNPRKEGAPPDCGASQRIGEPDRGRRSDRTARFGGEGARGKFARRGRHRHRSPRGRGRSQAPRRDRQRLGDREGRPSARRHAARDEQDPQPSRTRRGDDARLPRRGPGEH